MKAALMRTLLPPPLTDTHQQEQEPALDAVVVDPCGLAPLCDEPEFAALLDTMVADEAPRLFAVVQEYGVRADGAIVAWGMAFDDHAEVVSVGSGVRGNQPTAQDTLRLFHWGSHIRARLVWLTPDAATATEHADAVCSERGVAALPGAPPDEPAT